MQRRGGRDSTTTEEPAGLAGAPLVALALGCIIALLAAASFANSLFPDPAYQPAEPPQLGPPAATANLPSSAHATEGQVRKYVGVARQADRKKTH